MTVPPHDSRRRQVSLRALWASLRTDAAFTRVERWALWSLIGAGFVAGLVLTASAGLPGEDAVFQTLLTLAFALVLWRPKAFGAALLILLAVSPAVDAQQEAILALALGSGLIARTCTIAIQAAYVVAFFGAAILIHAFFPASEPLSSFIAAIIVATGSSGVGLTLRAVTEREMQAHRKLLVSEQARAEVAAGERRRIADDLHDVVAHDLTIIAMHARLLERDPDPDDRRTSQRAILDSARQALSDVRRVVLLASEDADPATGADNQRGVGVAARELARELTAAGYRVQLDDEVPDGADVDRLVSATLARIVREAGTNILKHAVGAQRVRIHLRQSDGELRLSVWNSLPRDPSASDAVSGGYGIVRMNERTAILGGSFESGPESGGWQMRASFPAR
ncbi:sensor histidine kinase [Microbacterium sp. cx-59]|uniref:sensor histidine kinase n=1 Tax=Microbacterium sp. cx-59 TaxID=2891207 RepID=UPI001E329EE2|nr:histidine kinase [Microbacterium sp. cx-59]MCC4907008.1 histidine kinase [Microbacterium sp. cx-59]